jgi:hypothetical protein
MAPFFFVVPAAGLGFREGGLSLDTSLPALTRPNLDVTPIPRPCSCILINSRKPSLVVVICEVPDMLQGEF